MIKLSIMESADVRLASKQLIPQLMALILTKLNAEHVHKAKSRLLTLQVNTKQVIQFGSANLAHMMDRYLFNVALPGNAFVIPKMDGRKMEINV